MSFGRRSRSGSSPAFCACASAKLSGGSELLAGSGSITAASGDGPASPASGSCGFSSRASARPSGGSKLWAGSGSIAAASGAGPASSAPASCVFVPNLCWLQIPGWFRFSAGARRRLRRHRGNGVDRRRIRVWRKHRPRHVFNDFGSGNRNLDEIESEAAQFTISGPIW